LKILLDECVDPKAAKFFSNQFEVKHLRDVGWLGIKNGELVKQASQAFDVLFTIDSNMRHQTSLKGLSLIVVVAQGHFRVVEDYKEHIAKFELLYDTLQKGQYQSI
jgi:predicted nuclease of predicted toxin-antitoxin system